MPLTSRRPDSARTTTAARRVAVGLAANLLLQYKQTHTIRLLPRLLNQMLPYAPIQTAIHLGLENSQKSRLSEDDRGVCLAVVNRYL